MCEYAVKRLSCFQFGSFLYIGAKKTEVRAMKITKVKIEKFSAPLKEPFRVAFGVIEDADSWTVKIETDEGIFGLDLCTASMPDSFFSYRRDGICGRQANVIWIA